MSLTNQSSYVLGNYILWSIYGIILYGLSAHLSAASMPQTSFPCLCGRSGNIDGTKLHSTAMPTHQTGQFYQKKNQSTAKRLRSAAKYIAEYVHSEHALFLDLATFLINKKVLHPHSLG